jgi:propionyl-CoA carboxylase alpha chain
MGLEAGAGMFTKILIANRGEIACRIIRTAHRLGIGCVAVYSEPDRRMPFVHAADEAICIGPASAAQSYLAIEPIIAACRSSGAEAVHPGYGFLSENAAFAAAVEEAGVTFIGPNRHALATMGDKLAAKQVARAAGVATVPGSRDAVADLAQARSLAEDIGYPVMLKPSAGGGGKGMRIAFSNEDLCAGFARARSEAASAFNDDRLFIEKFIAHPRHIEMQILGDRFGTIVHLGERECSIQRRHQKLIEEAPSPYVDAPLRRRMGEAAIALAKAVDYDSAGTVEFIVEPASGAFYFLEMNTRLQVEHPVTELVTGRDLVEDMIRIAAGEPLAIAQADVDLAGWAIESRIYAEDPSRDFLPTAGRLMIFQPPETGDHNGARLRHDTGVIEGSEISIHYDPMISKLITHAADRASAIAAHADALDQFLIEGVGNNVPFLAALLQNPRFSQGLLATDFIAMEYPHGFALRAPIGDDLERLAVVAASIDHVVRLRDSQISGQVTKAQTGRAQAVERCVLFGDIPVDVGVEKIDDGLLIRISSSGRAFLCQSSWRPGMRLWAGTIGGETTYVEVRRHLDRFILRWRDMIAEMGVYTRRVAELVALMPRKNKESVSRYLRSPMPGLVKAILVQAGQAVRQGDIVCIIEAMKMEMALRAEHDAIVREIYVAEGAALGVDAPILEFV